MKMKFEKATNGKGEGFEASQEPMRVRVILNQWNKYELCIGVMDDEDPDSKWNPMGFWKDEAQELIDRLQEKVDEMRQYPY
jgi:hypothetical protein